MARIAVIGTGYVGLTTGAYLAHLGHDVVCADVVAEKVEQLNRGEIPIVEAGLEDLVREGLAHRTLRFVVGGANAAPGAEFVFLCVPTPQGDDGAADLSYIRSAAGDIAPHLAPGSVVINKSTVPVGSTKVVERALCRDDIFVVSNPEFLREGSAVHDSLHPDRIVVGGTSEAACQRVAALYAELDATVILCDAPSAETIKYASNAFLATKISFVNAIANVCEAVGADIRHVAAGMGADTRIGEQFLVPGPGWGGSCFGKDTKALIRLSEDRGYDFDLLRGVIQVNESQFTRVVRKVRTMAGGELEDAHIAVWGLTFKAGTDDLRDSPALAIIRRLRTAGAVITAYDPTQPSMTSHPALEGVLLMDDAYEACTHADVLLILTEWPEFADAHLDRLRELLAEPRIVDARNLLDPIALRDAGFAYESIGRPVRWERRRASSDVHERVTSR
jgi:UDPglucose 6-dehydrogenase